MSWQPACRKPLFEKMKYNRVRPFRPEAAGRSRSASGTISAATRRMTARSRCAARPSISASPISTSPTITARLPAAPKPPSARSCAPTLRGLRDELIISSKAGYDMWPGPYGEWGSRKYLIASCDQSLKRMGLDYVDIFYSHRFDPDTPLEETCGALDHIVRSGRALYVGISSYNSQRTREAAAILKDLGTPCLIHQPSYSMLNRWVEDDGLLDTLDELGIGSIVFSPLAQGMLTTKYLGGIPEDSRAAQNHFLKKDFIRPQIIDNIRKLNEIAENAAARRWRRWRSPGCCAAAASPRR